MMIASFDFRQQEPYREGRTKQLYHTENECELILRFKDDATTYDGFWHSHIDGKGAVNNQINQLLMHMLEAQGIGTHLIREEAADAMRVRKLRMIPLEVVVRNVAAGSLSRRLGLPEGTQLENPVIEYNFKSDELGDPLVNEYHIAAMGWATAEQLREMAFTSFRVNQLLKAHLAQVGIELVDFKLEYGVTNEGELVLADEITPDTCRLWDSKTHRKMDKEHFEHDHDGT